MGQRRLALGCGHHPYPGSRAAPSAHHMLPPQCQDERGGVSLSGTCCQVLCGGCKTNNLVWADNLEQINVSSADLRINAMTVSAFHSATADLSTVVVWKCWNVTFLKKLSFWSLFLWQSSTNKIGVSHFLKINQHFIQKELIQFIKKKIAKYFVILININIIKMLFFYPFYSLNNFIKTNTISWAAKKQCYLKIMWHWRLE